MLESRVVLKEVTDDLKELRVGCSEVHVVYVTLRSTKGIKSDELSKLATELVLEGNDKEVDSLDLVVL